MSLVLKDITRRFGAVAAVSGASLAVDAGEIVVLFGPSGCGKTTLLRVAAGLERADSGSVALAGASLSGGGRMIPPEKREMGFVFQDYVLFAHMTALDNVAFGLNALPTDERRARALAELKACGLEGFDARYPHELSGGQQQRAALARALARRPKAMLLDEPFAAIDAALRSKLREEVREILKGAGAATILVTHDADEALALGDRIALMKEGRIIEAAAPQDLFERPTTAEGALLFAGAQRLDAPARSGAVETPFGAFDAKGVGDGPVTLVLAPGAVSIDDRAGAAVVRACRFVGPHWRVAVEVGGASLFGRATTSLAIGAPAHVTIDPALCRIFSR
jgi:iron(III) transport system ATP-binding protein